MTPDEISKYTQTLRNIAASPLEFCPHFPQLANKWESWWAMENTSPFLIAERPNPEMAPPPQGKLLQFLDQPQRWLAGKEEQLRSLLRTKDALPLVRTDIGPVSVAAFLGAPLHLKPNEETAWQDPIIEDWDQLPSLEIDPENRWFRMVMELAALTAEQARGRYLVCTPDLSGPTDILANLRGSQDLCFDLSEYREKVRQITHRLIDAWEFAHQSYYSTVLSRGAGIIQWVTSWSNQPYTVPTCDFNALIGPKDFNELCLPAYEEQCRRTGRVCFHLDGPDAARHAPALAKSSLTAIQFTAGAGAPSPLPFIPAFKAFLDAGKPVFIVTPWDEIQPILKALGSTGVALEIPDCPDPASLRQLDSLAGW